MQGAKGIDRFSAVSSESDTPNAGGAQSGGGRAPRRAPSTTASATTTSSTPAKAAPARKPAAAKSSTGKPAAARPTAAKSPARSAAGRAPRTAAARDKDSEIEFVELEDVAPDLVETPDAPTTAPAAKAPAAPRKRPATPRKAPQTAAATPSAGPAAPRAPRTPSKPRTPSRPRAAAAPPPSVVRDIDPDNIVLSVTGLMKKFGGMTAVAGIDLAVPQGSFYGIVGPNGAGKTTTLSMVTGLLRPDAGTITVLDQDVWRDPAAAKRLIGVLPDRLRLFDRLTGRQLLFYSGTLRGLDAATVRRRSDDLAVAFGLEEALGRLVADYSAGMTKKIALACSMIHSPRLLVLDEPFESVDPVSAANVVEILQKYVTGGGTVVLSSHSMDMIQRVCDRVAIIVEGRVLAKGTVDEVRQGGTLEQRFVELAGGRKSAEGMEWLLSSSD